jgi:hypothetical protein
MTEIGVRCVKSATVVVFAMMLMSCASGSDSSEPEIGPINEVRSTAEVVLPLDAYGLNHKEYLTVRRAAWRLISRCVERFGGVYTMSESAMLGDVPQFERPHERRYGLYDAESAATRGYNLPAEQLPIDNQGRSSWDPSDAELLLVRGRTAGGAEVALPTDDQGRQLPEDGCQGEADRELADGTPVPANERLGNELSVEQARAAEADSRVRDVIAKWSECMARSGYQYETVWEPNDRAWPDPANDEEIATAKADVACKQETNLVGTWAAVETAYHERAIDERAEELTDVQTYSRALATNAARIVGQG